MTLHREYRRVGILSHHVADMMFAGDETDPMNFSALEYVSSVCVLRSWEADTFEVCGCRVQQHRDGSIEVDQQTMLVAFSTLSITEHRRRHEHEVVNGLRASSSHHGSRRSSVACSSDRDCSHGSTVNNRCVRMSDWYIVDVFALFGATVSQTC